MKRRLPWLRRNFLPECSVDSVIDWKMTGGAGKKENEENVNKIIYNTANDTTRVNVTDS